MEVGAGRRSGGRLKAQRHAAPVRVSAPVTKTRSSAVSPGLSCVMPLPRLGTTRHGVGAPSPTSAVGGGAAGAGFGLGFGFGARGAATATAGFGFAASLFCGLASRRSSPAVCRALSSLSLQNAALRTSVSSRSATCASSCFIRTSAFARLRWASACASLAPAAAVPLRRTTAPRIGTSSGVKMSPSRRSKSRTSAASGRASLASANVLQTLPSRALTLQRTGSGWYEDKRCAGPTNEAAAAVAAAALSMQFVIASPLLLIMCMCMCMSCMSCCHVCHVHVIVAAANCRRSAC